MEVVPARLLVLHKNPVAPVAYQVILEPGIGQFREFAPPECTLV